MSNVELTSRINPQGNPIKVADDPIGPPVKDSNSAEKVDFKALLGNSNYELAQEKKAKQKGDFSGAKTDEDLFNALNQSTEKKAAPKNKMDKDDFLKLFIAQLQNQDPLKPKEDTEMAAQLAQFNGLEQMLNVNKKLEDLANLQKNGQALSMIDYVGKEVMVDGGKVRFVDGAPENVSFKLDRPVSNALLEVRDAGGSIVASSTVGDLKDGQHLLKTEIKKSDGTRIGDGVYTLSLSALNEQNIKTDIPLSVTTAVTGVNLKAGDGSFYTSVGELKGSDLVSVGTKGYFKPSEDSKKVSPQQGVGKKDENVEDTSGKLQAALEQGSGQETGKPTTASEQNATSTSKVAAPASTQASDLEKNSGIEHTSQSSETQNTEKTNPLANQPTTATPLAQNEAKPAIPEIIQPGTPDIPAPFFNR